LKILPATRGSQQFVGDAFGPEIGGKLQACHVQTASVDNADDGDACLAILEKALVTWEMPVGLQTRI
jgi:hypothetical protein